MKPELMVRTKDKTGRFEPNFSGTDYLDESFILHNMKMLFE